MEKKKMGFWAPIAVLAAALLMLAMSTDAADAARGGNGGGKPNESSASLWLEPALDSYPAYGFAVKAKGSGFNPDSVVQISQAPNGAISNLLADSNGNIELSWSTGAPGTYTFSAYQDMQGHRWTVYASVIVEVVAP